MIRREHFCNKLVELKYRYKRETDRVYMYKRPGDPSYVFVPRKDLLDEDNVRNQLRLCGCSSEDIEKFMVACRVQ